MDRELGTIRYLLAQWTRWSRGWRPKLGYPGAVPYIGSVKGLVSMNTEDDEYDGMINANDMRVLEKCIRKLHSHHQNALRMLYLGEAGPVAWRDRRISMSHVRTLVGEAEKLLIPLVKSEGVLL